MPVHLYAYLLVGAIRKMTDKREQQYRVDETELVRILREYQHNDGHCEITVSVQHGFVTLIRDERKRKPHKVA